jgi:carbamoyl-phosphate synthase small subunit
MTDKLYLALENGAVFEGQAFGSGGEVTGELVFATGMTGYLETLTDPSYHGQIVLQTFPLIGNYGVIPADFESAAIGTSAYIVKHPCGAPSNFRSEGELDGFLRDKGVVGLYGVDTRQLTKIIRENGVMNGRIMQERPTEADLDGIRAYAIRDAVAAVSCKQKKLYEQEGSRYTVALLDYGMKTSILKELMGRGCDVWVFPHDSTPEDILSVSPDGIMLSNGPGDPAENVQAIQNIGKLLETKIPLFGICLGHQLLALANGFTTGKLKYGHRGANQPVKDLLTGKAYITSQNHGYAVLWESVDPAVADKWFVNINDGTCEGISYKAHPACSVQFHPEASAGPKDTAFLFDRLIQSMGEAKHDAQ